MELPQSNTQTPVYFYTSTEFLSLRTKTSLLSLSTVDRLMDLNIGCNPPCRHRSSRGVRRKKQDLHPFIVASFNALHWLPVKVSSTYKIACLCYHCHSSTAPSYVTGMLHRKPLHTRNTRSSSYTMPLLNRHAHSKATHGDLSFSFASSSVWNSILNDVRCATSLSPFKSRLNTYLFRSVYKH